MADTVDRQPAPPDAAAEKPLASHGRRVGIALAALAVLAGVAGILLAGRFLLNLHFMREYDAGRYDAAGPQALTYVNFAEPWVAYHNLGCATYMLGSYDLAEGAFVQALDTKPPHEGEYPACECDIRLNLALSIVRPLDLGWKTEQERQSLIAALSRARGHLTDAGCANPEKGVYDGHFDKAEQLKKEMGSIEASMKKNAEWSRRAEGDKSRNNPMGSEDHFRRAFEAKKASKLMSLSKNLENRNERKLAEKESLLKDLEREQTLKITGSTHHDRTPIMLKDVSICRYGEVIASGISLTVERGKKISLQGHNGCGKSTLIKYLAGVGEEEGITLQGDVHVARGLKLSYVGQDTSSLRGCLFDICTARGADRTQFSTILVKMGFTGDMLYRDAAALSLGQKKFVMLALSLCEQADVYLWDEPLNYIDVYMRKEIERLVRDSDVTMLFVEHDRAFAEAASDEEYVIE